MCAAEDSCGAPVASSGERRLAGGRRISSRRHKHKTRLLDLYQPAFPLLTELQLHKLRLRQGILHNEQEVNCCLFWGIF